MRILYASIKVRDAGFILLVSSIALPLLDILIFESLPDSLERSRLVILQVSIVPAAVVAVILASVPLVLAYRNGWYTRLLVVIRIVLLVEFTKTLVLLLYVSLSADTYWYLAGGFLKVLLLWGFYSYVKLLRRQQQREDRERHRYI